MKQMVWYGSLTPSEALYYPHATLMPGRLGENRWSMAGAAHSVAALLVLLRVLGHADDFRHRLGVESSESL